MHIAWLLNFKLIFSSYKPHLLGLRHLIDLALYSPLATPPHFTFLSSISAVGLYHDLQAAPDTTSSIKTMSTPDFDTKHGVPVHEAEVVPELPIHDPHVSLPQGYAQAKYCAERIIEEVVKQRPELKATVVRSGQISGAEETGWWARSEYMPTLMRLSVKMGMVPEDLPVCVGAFFCILTMRKTEKLLTSFPIIRRYGQDVLWLPVNIAARILYAQINHHHRSAPTSVYHELSTKGLAFYHLGNAQPRPWKVVSDAILDFASSKRIPDDATATLHTTVPPRLVPMKEWLEAATRLSNAHREDLAITLTASPGTTPSTMNDKESSQASHLLEFYEMYVGDGGVFMPRLDVRRTREAAGELVDFEVGEALVRRYVERACADA